MNARICKKISLMIVVTLLLVTTVSIFSMQLSPVSAQTSAASLTGTITDRGIDTDDDGAFNIFEVGVEVNVSTAGTFTVEVVGLYDEANIHIDISNQTSKEVAVGITVFYVSFSGMDIYDSGVSPSMVAIIDIVDESADIIDSAFDIPLSREYLYTEFQPPVLEIDYQFDEIEREITLGQGKSMQITNTYAITNNGDNIQAVEFGLPEDAYDITVRDAMGNLETSLGSKTMTVNLRATFYSNETAMLYLTYNVPWEKYVTQQNGVDYTLDYTFYEQFDWTLGKLTVSVTLPEGAEYQSSTPLGPHNMDKSGLKDTVTFTFSDVKPSEDLNFEIKYRYLLFWSSLYPTIWVGVLVVIASAFTFLWKAPKPVTTRIIAVPPEDVRKFVDVYEEKTKIKAELESMEERLRKGKIPRRRFKIRKRMLDGRLSTISRDLSSFHDKIRTAGPKYADMMRQIEVAEANLEGAERDIQRVKTRYRRGEVSKGAYGKLMDEYNRRIEEAEATIDGIILRLREEIR